MAKVILVCENSLTGKLSRTACLSAPIYLEYTAPLEYGMGEEEGNRHTTTPGISRRGETVPAVFFQIVVASLTITLTLVLITLESAELLVVAESGSVAAPAAWPPSLYTPL